MTAGKYSRFEDRQVRVKICGITDITTALAAVEAGADALGFVFAASRRRVTPEAARDIILNLPPFVARVGVFVDTPPRQMVDIAVHCGLTAIQLSGEASSGCSLDCARCPGQIICASAYEGAQSGKSLYCNLPVIKTLRVGGGCALPGWSGCRAAAFLFDTYKKDSYGGTGETFNWKLLQDIKCPRPVILAGGLTAANVRNAIKVVKPYAVDVSGGVETDGRKDLNKIREFILQAKGVLI